MSSSSTSASPPPRGRVCVDTSSAVYGSYSAARSCERATRGALTAQRDAAVTAAHGVALAAR